MKKTLTLSLITFASLFLSNCGGSSNDKSYNSTLSTKFKLPDAVTESSGLLKLDNQLWTHNDSANSAKLYKIDENNGNIIKVVTINNATNIDWEDLSYDDTYVYIGDFGNYLGDRKDLKIYKIPRNALKSETSITAEIINFTYSDQIDFTDTNFDCEAMISYHGKLYLFSKDWEDKKTRLYELDTTPGIQIAQYKDTLNIKTSVTGASINKELDILLLSTYSSLLTVNIWAFSNYKNSDFFQGDLKKLTFEKPLVAQVEGITFIDNYKVYLSSETFTNDEYKVYLDSKLYELDFSKEF